MIDQGRMKQVADADTVAWNSGSADAVAESYAPDGRSVIDRGQPWEGRGGLLRWQPGSMPMPDLHLTCDGLRAADDHVLYLWTYTGTDAGTGRPVRVSGWEEWDVDEDLKVKSSRGWYPTADEA